MDAGAIIAIVVGGIALLGLVVALATTDRERRKYARRVQAAEVRREARLREAQAEAHKAEAEERAARSRRERALADEQLAYAERTKRFARDGRSRAEELDPGVALKEDRKERTRGRH